MAKSDSMQRGEGVAMAATIYCDENPSISVNGIVDMGMSLVQVGLERGNSTMTIDTFEELIDLGIAWQPTSMI